MSEGGHSGTRAGGGPVIRGTPYLVGERGPEMFVPSQSGTIVPNGRGAQQVDVRIVIDDGGVGWLRSLIRAEIDDVGGRAYDRRRAGG